MFRTIKHKLSNLLIRDKIMLLISLFGFVMIGFYTYFSYSNEKEILSKSIDEKLIAAAYGVYYAFGDA
ncbi:MAG: hypothetical protein HF309_04645, partial [Ignavibacteria bacterium]|nr:hypothetical protein [Ignavibacteria bacterium]